MKIRKAEAKDHTRVMELYNGLVGEDRYSGGDKDIYDEIIKSPVHCVFVAEQDGVIIGFASASVRRTIRYVQPILELDELFVDSESRSNGVGRSLLEAVEDFGKENNCYRLYIASGFQHEIAHAFYEHRGYKKNGYHFLKNL